MNLFTKIRKAVSAQSFMATLAATTLLLGGMGSAQTVPQIKHVVVVALENHSYSQVIGSSAMPYFNELAQKHTLATHFYATTHPSIGNYFRLFTGQTITNSDGYTGTISVNSLVKEMDSAGISWSNFAESQPYEGYIGGDKTPYAKHHNPETYMTYVINSSTQRAHLKNFNDFKSELSAGTLPRFSFVVPNNWDNAHSCPGGASTCSDWTKLNAADRWLQANMSALFDDSGRLADTLVVLWWDEGAETDTSYGGGHTAVVLMGGNVKTAYHSTLHYNDDALLHTIAKVLGLTSFPGASASAPVMSDIF